MLDFNNVTPTYRRVNFDRVNGAALAVLPALLKRWLPGGKIEGCEYVVRNPRRADQHFGSFKVNLRTGRWSDFATGDGGRDPVSLAAFLANLSQVAAAKELADMLGVEAHDA
jgi:hypothetical protein